MKKVWVILAEGFEEIEAITPIDVLRRAGLDVTVVGLEDTKVRGAHNVLFEADTKLESLDGLPDAIVLPGGLPGAENLKNSNSLKELILEMDKDKRVIAAICASPALVLNSAGVLSNKKATCYPGFEDQFSSDVEFSEDRVVKADHILTSRGPGSALEFSLELVALLKDSSTKEELTKGMIAPATAHA